MLIINESLYIAKGTHRCCYIHPHDDNLCIKIPLNKQGKQSKNIQKALNREHKYYKRLSSRNISWKHLSEYKGDIDTNLGKGSIYQLIKDDNGLVSKSLEYYLQNPSLIKDYEENFVKQLDCLYEYMSSNKILTTSLLPRNIAVQKTDCHLKLWIIDDIGNSEFIPISEVTSRLIRKKIKRKWNEMVELINTHYPNTLKVEVKP
ncbi:YrbL family protein [Parashewanella tropica]|uniref:YrbL family protein n=1 Tax=Parashewanella tropica TaxID=2547970 RepID=UPI0010594C4E|nr:YrbL family protein [Parashewanella tropica]